MKLWLCCLLTWNLVSTLILLASISVYGTTSAETSHEITSRSVEASLGHDVTIEDKNSSTGLNDTETEEAQSLEVANCTLDEAEVCSGELSCADLNGYCIDCAFNLSCDYGSVQKAKCSAKPGVNCTGSRHFEREYDCSYCYQLPSESHWCSPTMDCALNKPRSHYPARPHYISTCWTREKRLCLGRRCFYKQLPCNWSSGYKWSTAMLLSVFLGGFGFDRFYLGLWQHGIGKLLSFGGLGVWTLVDVILIGVGYVGPWDGSLYI